MSVFDFTREHKIDLSRTYLADRLISDIDKTAKSLKWKSKINFRQLSDSGYCSADIVISPGYFKSKLLIHITDYDNCELPDETHDDFTIRSGKKDANSYIKRFERTFNKRAKA